MSDQSGERTLLGGAISVEFSECSVAAADLSDMAKGLLDRQHKTQKFYLVDGQDASMSLDYRLLTKEDDAFRLDGIDAQLVLAQPTPRAPERGRLIQLLGRGF